MQDVHEREVGDGDKGQTSPDDKGFSIIVNGRERTVDDEEVNFDQVVGLAFDSPPTGEFICFTITYRRAGGRKPECQRRREYVPGRRRKIVPRARW